MEFVLPTKLLHILMISMMFSVILMAFIQKCKTLKIIRKSSLIWLLNFIFSFLLGIPFAHMFYEVSWLEGIWVAIFSFIGAPGLYETLKNQQIISYKPKSVSEIQTIEEPTEKS